MRDICEGYVGDSTSKSEYMIVKKTCMKRLTALTMTLNRYSHASPTDQQSFRGQGPVIVAVWMQVVYAGRRFDEEAGDEVGELMALLAVMTKLWFLGSG